MIPGRSLSRLSVRRSYPAPRDLVYRALTEADWLERWFCPWPDVTVKVTQVDLRVGGRYRLAFRFPGDRTAVVVGEYRTLARPRRLAFTWTWEPPDPHAGIETLVTIDLYEKEGGTELALTHARFPTTQLMRQHESGWGATLDRLKELIAKASDETRLPSKTRCRHDERSDHMAMIDAVLMELEQEAQVTRRHLERVPEDKLSWKPHPKSSSLGQIALHMAQMPGGISTMAAQEVYELPTFEQQEPENRAEILETFERSLSTAREVLGHMDDRTLMGTWTLQDKGQVLMSLPRAALLRSILLNHYYHHRGQLSVYLRLLNVPVPSTYGPTADENPFTQPAAATKSARATV